MILFMIEYPSVVVKFKCWEKSRITEPETGPGATSLTRITSAYKLPGTVRWRTVVVQARRYSAAMSTPLSTYQTKRNFAITPEPAEGGSPALAGLTFVIQKHWASRLHYDFRLELDGTMKSWAVPKGPSYDPHDKRMAVHVEDHPIAYSDFEGTIPEGQYGAGKVIIWDNGTWEPEGDPRKGYKKGELKFTLHGHKLRGRWVLVRMKGRGEKQEPWLLIKENDAFARPAGEFSVVDEEPDSVREFDHAAGKRAALPESLSPQLATLVEQPPASPQDWLFEVKFDGYRLLARVQGKDVRLFTRNGHDWSRRLPDLHAELRALKLPDGWYDGEIVVNDAQGRPNFGRLQQAFDAASTDQVLYYLFDMPYHDGEDWRAVPLEQRRARLREVLAAHPSETVRLSEEIGADPATLLAAACQLGLEGLIGKRRDAHYTQRRSRDWVKLKCGQRQEFVIGGYTDPQGSRVGIGSLLLGVYDEAGVLRYAGNVGSGFNDEGLRSLLKTLHEHASDESPFTPARIAGRKPHWVKPALVAEVRFAEWTHSGSVRHAVFVGLRTDKRASTIRREKAEEAPVDTPAVTHGERVIDKASGITKLELNRYYALVGELMLAHMKCRPLALVRAPSGVGGQLFFQKHADVDKLPGVLQLDAALDPGHPAMLAIASVEGILSAAQWNVVEFHSQNADASKYEQPNRLVFDLDPGEGVGWAGVQEAAQLLRALLEELGLVPFLKTSGGKGLHLVVPIRRGLEWDPVKDFSRAVVEHMARLLPQRFALKSGPRNRVGKIFIDYLRNGRGATTACAWSARARPGLGISVPLAWDELGHVKAGDQWTIRNVQARLDKGNEPWAAYSKSARGLAAAIRRLSRNAS